MKQYQVPQFINVEDRIIGPLTLKQFLYLLGAAGIAIIGITMFHIFLFIAVALPLAAFFLALAFVKVSSQPLPTIVSNALSYYTHPRLYLWRHVEQKEGSGHAAATLAPTPPSGPAPEGAPSESKLADLAWSLDIKERVERRYR